MVTQNTNKVIDMQIDKMVVREFDGEMFNLNDLHKSAGGRSDQAPALFMRSKQVSELSNELFKVYGSVPFKKVMGRNGGTYARKEIIYAYAMWISPEFHLKVIQCFDEVVSKNPVVISNLDRISSEVRRSTEELMAVVDESSITLAELKRHGSDWGSYGAAIRKVKAEATKQLNAVKAEIQLKLDLLG